MNPVTRRLLDDIDDPGLAEFALAWDEFEEGLVRAFRGDALTAPEEKRLDEVRRGLPRRLDHWEKALIPHWKATRIDGATPAQSPFRTVLGVERADLPGNRPAMRALPAAREALNMLLLERAARSEAGLAGTRLE
jgi:hypothetical protein